MKKKDGLIIGVIILLALILLFIAIAVINELKKDDIVGPNVPNKGNNETLVQDLTCSGTKPLNDANGNVIGTEITTYNFVFAGKNFNSYKKEILYSFDNGDAYQNFCLNCDNTEAESMMNLTNGLKVSINTSINKYIYEIVEIDVAKYDGPFRESKYGLDGLSTKSSVEDALFLTRDMICYWK